MNLFEEFIKKISDRVNWSSLHTSNQFEDYVNDYNNQSNLTKEYVNKAKSNFQNQLDLNTTYHVSIINDIKRYSQTGGKSLKELIEYAEANLNSEEVYVRLRDIYVDLKARIQSSGETPDEFEKAMLRELELQVFEIGSRINNPDKLWSKYTAAKEVMKINTDSLPSKSSANKPNPIKGDSALSSYQQYGSSTYDGKASLYRPSQTDIHWGQGNSEELLGMRATNNNFSGTDMVVTITLPGKGPVVIGELSQLSYSVFREKVPIRTLGRITPKGYTRGFRTITGILVFSIFDKSIVYQCLKELHKTGYRILMDEMPVFDVTVTMSNEFGHKSAMTIYGITTYTEGQIMGVDMMGVQNAYEFYAIDIDPMHTLKDSNVLQGTSSIDNNGNLLDESSPGTINYYKEAKNYAVNQQGKTDKSNKFTFERV